MGVTIDTSAATAVEGDGVTFPKKGDKLKMHYTGTLKKDGSKRAPASSATPWRAPRDTVLDARRGAANRFRVAVLEGRAVERWAKDRFPLHARFDSSRDRGKAFEFVIGTGQVIKGWDEGVAKMSLGQRATLRITADYGYGEKGHPPVSLRV